MSKINHSRPSLRYLDNFRREMKVEQQRTYWLDDNGSILAKKAGKKTRVEHHMSLFENFNPAVQATLERLIVAFVKSEEALGEVMFTIMKGSKAKRKSVTIRSEAARQELVVAGAVFLHQNFDEMMKNKSEAWNWLRGFLPLFKKSERMAWYDFLSTIFEESLPLCIAEKIGSTPEEVERLRALFEESETK